MLHIFYGEFFFFNSVLSILFYLLYFTTQPDKERSKRLIFKGNYWNQILLLFQGNNLKGKIDSSAKAAAQGLATEKGTK